MSRSTSSTTLARLRIISINDVYELANLPRLQTFLTGLSPKPSAVVLSGDFLSPSTLSSIDGGRGMVATLRTIGMTHVSLGNHEQDLRLDSLRQRLEELSAPTKSKILSNATVVLNSNMQNNLPSNAEWMRSVTQPYSLISSSCGNVKVALLGLLSDEPGIFRDNTFKSVPIQNVLETYTEMYNQLVTVPRQQNHNFDNLQHQKQQQQPERPVDLLLPLTHESIVRDNELAQHMMSLHGGSGVIIGGHEHDPYHLIVKPLQQRDDEDVAEAEADSSESDGDVVHILKSGMDARNAFLIDLVFEVSTTKQEQDQQQSSEEIEDGSCRHTVISRLVEIKTELIDLSNYEPSPFAQQIVDKHMSVVQALEDEIIIDADSLISLPPEVPLSSERSRFQQTTIGSVFCQMIKEELEDCDVAMFNGAVIKGDMAYENAKMSYAELKNELPFPTKIVMVEMTRREVYEAIDYSRTAMEGGMDLDAKEVPRRGYLQVDYDCDHQWSQDILGDANFEDHNNKEEEYRSSGR